MQPKSLFLQDKQTSDLLRAVVHQQWFHVALTFVRAELIARGGLTGEQLKGALLFEDVLLGLPDEPAELAPDQPILNHGLDSPRKEPRTDKPKTEPEK